MKSLFKTVFLIIIFSGLTRLFGFIFRIWLSRTIGAEALGVYQISFSVFMVLLTLVSSGIPLIVSRITAKCSATKDKKTESKTVTTALILALIISAVVSVIVVIFAGPISHIFADESCIILLLVLLPALIFSSVYSTIRGSLWGKNNYLACCSSELFEQVMRIIVCFILLCGIFPGISGEIGAALSLTIACVLSCTFVTICYFKTGGRFSKPDKKQYVDILKTSSPITFMRVASSLIQPVVALIIPLRLVAAGYTNAQALSLYGIASGMTLPLLYIPMTIIGSLSFALVPDLASASAKNDEKYISQRVTTSIVFSLFVAFLVAPIFMGVGELIGIFFFDNATSGILLSASAWTIIPLCLTNISSSILNAMGLELKSFKNYILGAIIMLACIWFLPKYVGINALIWAMGGCFTTSSLLNIRMIKKQVCPSFKISKYFLKFIAISIPVVALCSFVGSLLNLFMPLFFNLLITCLLGVLFFVLLCLVFNIFQFHAVMVWFKQNNPLKIHHRKKKV